MNKQLLACVVDEFIGGNPVSYEIGFEGQGIDDNGNYKLGCRSGPTRDIPNLLHEMGHLAEREIPKLLKKPHYGWGYYPGKFWQIGTSWGHESQNDKSVQREKRVWAYQLSLQSHYGILDAEEEGETEEYNLAKTVVWLDAFMFYKNNVISREEQVAIGYTASQKKAIQILANEIRQLSETEFTYEHFKAAWQERMEALSSVVQ